MTPNKTYLIMINEDQRKTLIDIISKVPPNERGPIGLDGEHALEFWPELLAGLPPLGRGTPWDHSRALPITPNNDNDNDNDN